MIGVLLAGAVLVQAQIAPEAAQNFVGKSVTVCGVIEDARYAERSGRQPTFLNFGARFPNHVFTAVIFGEDRPKFGTPETTYLGKRVCVNGTVEVYRDKPQIILRERDQLRVAEP